MNVDQHETIEVEEPRQSIGISAFAVPPRASVAPAITRMRRADDIVTEIPATMRNDMGAYLDGLCLGGIDGDCVEFFKD